MPIVRLIQKQNSAFGPEEIRLMVAAFEAACSASGLADPDNPRREIVAQKIIQAAQGGERDIARLRECGLMAAKQRE
jgi:hypothetical protein